MRPIVLLIALSISTTADANKRQARSSSAAEASSTVTRSGIADGGTLLDYVDRPTADTDTDTDTDTVTTSEEPAPERITEEQFVRTISIHGRPIRHLYYILALKN